MRDEFGQVEPALVGGAAARFALSFTRSGWHNPNDNPRSNLQRVNYRVEDGALWRDSYPVLDRAPDTEPQQVRLLEGVEVLELVFLGDLAAAQREGRGSDPRHPGLAGQLGGGHQCAGPRAVAAGGAGIQACSSRTWVR